MKEPAKQLADLWIKLIHKNIIEGKYPEDKKEIIAKAKHDLDRSRQVKFGEKRDKTIIENRIKENVVNLAIAIGFDLDTKTLERIIKSSEAEKEFYGFAIDNLICTHLNRVACLILTDRIQIPKYPVNALGDIYRLAQSISKFNND